MYELLTNPNNEGVFSLSSPYILRYLTVAAILTGNSQEILHKLQWRSQKYSDIFTKFIITLLEDFDIEKSRAMLPEILAEVKRDMFLKPLL